MNVIYNKVALIGLGLIASSMGHAMKAKGLAKTIVGYAKSQKSRHDAAAIGFVDHCEDSAAQAVKGADLVIFAVPIGAMGELAREISNHLSKGATISDVGSVKQAVIDAIAPHIPDHADFIPAHPLAGTEHSGPHSGFASLFENRWCILTPDADTNAQALERLSTLWAALGANIEIMSPERHDLILAVTSHLPHLIAYTMVGVADDLRRITDQEVINFSAAGFRDFTRIAASDPTMWRDVFLNNKDATLEILGRFNEELIALQNAIRKGDGEFLHDYFTHTRAIRRGILEAGQDTKAPNWGRDDRTK